MCGSGLAWLLGSALYEIEAEMSRLTSCIEWTEDSEAEPVVAVMDSVIGWLYAPDSGFSTLVSSVLLVTFGASFLATTYDWSHTDGSVLVNSFVALVAE